jgi:hypothetical protein
MEINQEAGGERRRCLRQRVHGPAFASFDGVTGGMILDLSQEGLSMQTGSGGDGQRRDWRQLDRRTLGGSGVDHARGEPGFGEPRGLRIELAEPAARLETTGYIAWADALGRAGVRFSDLPEEARIRLNDWLRLNAGAPSRTAPKLMLGRSLVRAAGAKPAGNADRDPLAISLEAESAEENGREHAGSTTAQYQFSSLGTDLAAALRRIADRALSLTRGTGAAIALVHKGMVICRASVGEGAPGLGTRMDVNSGFSGECFRDAKALRCDDAEHDPRVDLESCRRLRVRSMLAAPLRYERDTVGVLMVSAGPPFSFDEGDLAVVESLAHTVVVSMRQAEVGGRVIA